MAPEAFKGEKCDSTVDIYSLGIVMYRLLNNYRIPFMPNTGEVQYGSESEAANERMKGREILPPQNAEGKLCEIILKACKYNKKERYSSASDMRKDLEAVLNEKNADGLVFPDGDDVVIDRSESRDVSDDVSDKPSKSGLTEDPTGEHPGEEDTEGGTAPCPEDSGGNPGDEKESDDRKTEVVIEEPGKGTAPCPEGSGGNPGEEKESDAGETEVVLEEPGKETVLLQDDTGGNTGEEEEPSPKGEEPHEGKEHEEEKKERTVAWKKLAAIAGGILCAAIIVIIFFIPHNPKISGIDTKIELEKGQQYQLDYTVTPARFENEPVNFSIEDKSIASINSNDEIIGEAAGETKLKATIDDYSIEYDVLIKPATVTAIEGVKSTIKIEKGSSKRVKPVIQPEAARDRKIYYSIEDESIATVSSKGKITGKKKGKTTLTIKVGEMQKNVKITVNKKSVSAPHIWLTGSGANNIISWDKVKNASGYEIYSYDYNSNSFVRRITKGANDTQAVNKNLISGKTYRYKVKAYRIINGKKIYSKYSNEVSRTIG